MKKLSYFNLVIIAGVRLLWRLRRFRGRLFIIDHLLPVARAMVSRYGPIVRVRRHDYTNRAAIFGLYGDDIVEWIRRLQPRDVFLDIGANAGIFSLIADDLVSEGRVFSFEPNPALFADLRFNMRLNGARRITPLNIALGDVTGTFKLVHRPGHTGGAALERCSHEADGAGQRVEHIVVAVAPKELGAVLQEAAERRLCIKIDVEGFELNVLRGLHEAGLLAKAEWVIVEIDPRFLARFGSSVADVYELATAAGLEPTKGAGRSDHYDEMFVRPRPEMKPLNPLAGGA